MVTEVLLMADVSSLGEAGDIVNVADGYARNYLIPKNVAAPATEAMKRRLAKLQKQRQENLKARVQEFRELANRLSTVSCTITVKTGDDDKMYGSVTTGDIAAALEEQGIKLDRHVIVMEHPIKELGVFDLPVSLHPEVDASVKVWVVEE